MIMRRQYANLMLRRRIYPQDEAPWPQMHTEDAVTSPDVDELVVSGQLKAHPDAAFTPTHHPRTSTESALTTIRPPITVATTDVVNPRPVRFA